MRILMDVDGVCCDFLSPAIDALNMVTGKRHRVEDVTSWDIFGCFGYDKKVAAKVFDLLGTADHAVAFKPYDGAVEGVARLRELGELYVVTSPLASGPTWTRDRERWLLRHFKIPTSQVIHTSAKHVCAGDVLIEDRVDTLVRWESHNSGGHGVLFERTYAADGWNGDRVRDWPELVRLVESLAAMRAWRRWPRRSPRRPGGTVRG